MKQQTYKNKKGMERTLFTGPLFEFEKLGIDPPEVYTAKGTGLIRDPDEETRELLETMVQEQDGVVVGFDDMTAREWAMKSGRFLLTWIETIPKPTARSIVRYGGAERQWAKLGMYLMGREGWLTAGGKMSKHGRDEVALCLQMTDEAFPPSELDDTELADDTYDEIERDEK